jgi:hypothetical protein
MELLIAFLVAWVVKSVYDDKSSDFHGSKAEVARRINDAHPNWSKERRQAAIRNAQRRHGAGWLGYQLRHGWLPMFTDAADGYRAARLAHEKWKATRPPEPDGWWQKVKGAWRAGWAGAKSAAAQKAKAAAGRVKDAATGQSQAPVTEPAAAEDSPKPTATAQPMPQPLPAATGRTPEVKFDQGGTMSGETGGYAGAQDLTAGYEQTLAAAAEQLEQYEADIIAGGLGQDPAAMATLAQMREGLEMTRAAAGGHRAALNGHEQGAEYAQTKGDAAANTEWLGQG